jgi:magnesium transporter
VWDTLGRVLRCRLYRHGKVEDERLDPLRVSDVLSEDGTLVWLDLQDPKPDEIDMIRREFSLHELTVEDVENRGQRTKFEPYPGYYFLVLYGIARPADEVEEHEVHVFVGPRFLITVRYEPAMDLERVLERWERHPDMVKEGAGFLLYGLLDAIVDGYFEVVEALEDVTEHIEETVFEDRPDATPQERIFQVRKDLVQFRRRASPLREVVNALVDDERLVTDPLRFYYRDISDHVLRVIDFLDNVRELLTTAMEVRIAQVGNRLNEVMKKVTSWGAIILVPSLIAGFYGMNFVFLPWPLGSSWGVAITVVMMVVSGGVLYRLFKRRQWV